MTWIIVFSVLLVWNLIALYDDIKRHQNLLAYANFTGAAISLMFLVAEIMMKMGAHR